MHKRLNDAFADHPLVGEVRGFGLIGAIELVAQKEPPVAFDPALKVAIRAAKYALDAGIITRALPAADTLALSPPLTITPAEIDTLVDGLRESVDRVYAELKKSGDLRA